MDILGYTVESIVKDNRLKSRDEGTISFTASGLSTWWMHWTTGFDQFN